MGSAGLEWDAEDQPEAARLNQKTRFIGTGAQINGLSTTYPGQEAFCTSTGSGFTVDTTYVRNAANDTWDEKDSLTRALTASSEANTTPVTDGADFTATAGTRYYAFFTLPTTETLYIITGIEWKNGATVSGNVTAGIDVVNADPPTIPATPLLVIAQEVAQSGTSAVQRVSAVSSTLIRGGTICGAWVSCSSGTATLREQTGLSSQNQSKATSYSATPASSDTTAWTATTARKYLKVYYRGFA
jgi:hypothetical protein